MNLVFYVKGSAEAPYEVIFDELSKTITCNCAAGSNGQICKHRLGLITGDCPGYIIDSSASIGELHKMLHGSPMLDVIKQLSLLSSKKDNIDRQIKSLKKQLIKLMNN